MKIIFRRPNFSVLEFGPRRKNWAHAVATPDSMAATAAAVVAQRRRHEAAEAAANLAEGKDGTPRQQPLSPKKVPRKPKKVETKPLLPYQQEVFDFYQNEKIQIFVAVRGPRAAASRHNCPLSRSPGIRTIVPSTAPRRHAPSRRALTTTAPPYVAPHPHGCSCLLSQTSSSASRRRSTIHILTMCGPIYLRRFCPYLPPPRCPRPCAPSSLARADPHTPRPPLGQPPTLRPRTTPAKPTEVSPPQNPPIRRIHPPRPTLHSPPPQLKKYPQLWINVTAAFNVIFLIELLVNWYGSVWCAAALHPSSNRNTSSHPNPRHSPLTPSPLTHSPLTSPPLHPSRPPVLAFTLQVQELFQRRLEHFRFAHRLSRHYFAHRTRCRHRDFAPFARAASPVPRVPCLPSLQARALACQDHVLPRQSGARSGQRLSDHGHHHVHLRHPRRRVLLRLR